MSFKMSQSYPPGAGATTRSVFDMLEKRIANLEKRLLLLEPDSNLPALKDAYNEYKIIEKLALPEEN